MARKLKRIKLHEISLVTAPANRRKFLIIKEEKCSDCGGILKQVRIGEDDSCVQLKCSECGTLVKRNLKKEGYKMEKLIVIFKQLMGDDFEEFTKEETLLLKALTDESTTALTEAITTLESYKGDMPETLLGAVGTVVKHAVGKAPNPYVVPESNDEGVLDKLLEKYKKDIEDLEKSGKKLSKDTVEKIKSAIKSLTDIPTVIEALQSLLPEDTSPVKKEEKDIDKTSVIVAGIKEEVTGALSEVNKAIEKIAEDNKTAMDGLKKSSDDVGKRLETLENEKGVKKSIDDDGTGDDDKDIKKKGGWHTITDAMSAISEE